MEPGDRVTYNADARDFVGIGKPAIPSRKRCNDMREKCERIGTIIGRAAAPHSDCFVVRFDGETPCIINECWLRTVQIEAAT